MDDLDRRDRPRARRGARSPDGRRRTSSARSRSRASRRSAEHGGPFRHEPLSAGVPQPPVGPMYPAFAHVSGELYDALESLTRQLVWAADCAEFTDATGNARQYLYAAGHVDLAARAALALADRALVLDPPRYVRDLLAAVDDPARVTYQLPLGHVPRGAGDRPGPARADRVHRPVRRQPGGGAARRPTASRARSPAGSSTARSSSATFGSSGTPTSRSGRSRRRSTTSPRWSSASDGRRCTSTSSARRSAPSSSRAASARRTCSRARSTST